MIVYPIVLPALTSESSATFATVRFGQFTVMTTGSVEGEPSLLDVAWATFETLGQLAVEVVDEMCTDREAPEASETPLAPPQLSTGGTAALIAHEPQPADALSKLQVPVLVGNVSDSFTPAAVPGPLLWTVIV